jgi:Fic family protein
VRVRFKTVPARQTPAAMRTLIGEWDDSLDDRAVHPVIAMAAMNLDFLCIHPFRDGNGRVSRLLLLLQCYHLGYAVGRFISLERVIEENKDRYYETLEQSSQGWHEGKHDPWPYINYILYILKTAFREFEERVDTLSTARGAKTAMVLDAIERLPDSFKMVDLERAASNVTRNMIRVVLNHLKKENKIYCEGYGAAAVWRKGSKKR